MPPDAPTDDVTPPPTSKKGRGKKADTVDRAQVAALGAAGPAVTRPTGTLVLVGCVASDGEGATIETWAGAALEAARMDGNTDHGSYLLVPYGLGVRLATAGIAGALRTGLLTMPPRLTIPAGHPLEGTLVPILAAHGAVVVRGVR